MGLLLLELTDNDHNTHQLSSDSESEAAKSWLLLFPFCNWVTPTATQRKSIDKKGKQKFYVKQPKLLPLWQKIPCPCRIPSLIVRSWLRTYVFKAFNATACSDILDCFQLCGNGGKPFPVSTWQCPHGLSKVHKDVVFLVWCGRSWLTCAEHWH